MNRKILYLVILLIFVPLIAVKFIPGDAGMAVCFILFFAINPIAAIIVGINSGRDLKSNRFLPLIFSILFILGAWVAFGMGVKDFYIYALVYLAIGYLTAIIGKFLLKL